MQSTEYIPGVCNINREEIAYRRKAAIGGLVVAGVLFAVLTVAGVSPYIRAVAILLPLIIGAVGVLQVRNKFCVSYGASGKQNASEGSDTAEDVVDSEAKRLDKQKARKMNTQAIVASIIIAALTVFIPSL